MTVEGSTEIPSRVVTSTPHKEIELSTTKDGDIERKPSGRLLNITKDYVLDNLSEEILEAHQQAISAQKHINSLRPTPPTGVSAYGAKEFNYTNNGNLIFSAIMTPIFLTLNVLSFVIQAPGLAYAIFPLIATSGFLLVKSIGVLYNPYSKEKQSIKKLFSKLFLTKNQRNKLSENYRKHQEYMLAFNSYQLFIDTKLATLNKTEALSLIELNCNKPYEKTIMVNELGEFEWGNYQYQKAENSNNITLASKILKEIEAENKKLTE